MAPLVDVLTLTVVGKAVPPGKPVEASPLVNPPVVVSPVVPSASRGVTRRRATAGHETGNATATCAATTPAARQYERRQSEKRKQPIVEPFVHQVRDRRRPEGIERREQLGRQRHFEEIAQAGLGLGRQRVHAAFGSGRHDGLVELTMRRLDRRNVAPA